MTAEDEVGVVGSESAARPREVAGYVADITSQLAAMARDARLPFLAQALDVAQLAAAESAAEPPGPRRRP